MNVDAIPTWNIQQTANGTVRLSGGILGSANTITGLTTLNYNDNGFGGSLDVGTAVLPILPATGSTFDGFQLTVANAPVRGGGAHDVDVSMSKTGFTAAGQAITVTADAVGTGTDFSDAYGIGAGSPTVGFTTWNIASDVASGPSLFNNLRIGADGNSSATKIVLTDDGSNTILWSAGSDVSGSQNTDWANIKDVNLSGTTGWVTLTGAESGSEGLLNSDTTALVTIEGGKGNSLYDLSSLTPATVNAAAFSIAGGSSTANDSIVEFNNAAITGATHLIDITNISVLNDASNSQGGTINMVNWAQQGVPGARYAWADSAQYGVRPPCRRGGSGGLPASAAARGRQRRLYHPDRQPDHREWPRAVRYQCAGYGRLWGLQLQHHTGPDHQHG